MASYNSPSQNVPIFDTHNFKNKKQLTIDEANDLYVRFPKAQSNIKLQNAVIDGNLIQNDELVIENTNDRILVTDANKNVVSSNISSNVFSFLQGLTGNIQDQLDEKPIVYWNNTGEQITDPVILVGTVQSVDTGYTIVNLDTSININKRTELVIPIESDISNRPIILISDSTTTGRTNSQLSFQCRGYISGVFPLLDDITCLYIVIGEPT